MKTRLLSVLLVFLLIASVTVPAVSAEPIAPVVAPVIAAPATAEMIVNGVAVVMAGVTALQIAENLGKVWDNTQKGWDQLMKDTGAALDNLIHGGKWIDATSSEADALFDWMTWHIG